MTKTWYFSWQVCLIGLAFIVFAIAGLIFKAPSMPDNTIVVKGEITDYTSIRINTSDGSRTRYAKEYHFIFDDLDFNCTSSEYGGKAFGKSIKIYVNKLNPSDNIPVSDYWSSCLIYYVFIFLGTIFCPLNILFGIIGFISRKKDS